MLASLSQGRAVGAFFSSAAALARSDWICSRAVTGGVGEGCAVCAATGDAASSAIIRSFVIPSRSTWRPRCPASFTPENGTSSRLPSRWFGRILRPGIAESRLRLPEIPPRLPAATPLRLFFGPKLSTVCAEWRVGYDCRNIGRRPGGRRVPCHFAGVQDARDPPARTPQLGRKAARAFPGNLERGGVVIGENVFDREWT